MNRKRSSHLGGTRLGFASTIAMAGLIADAFTKSADFGNTDDLPGAKHHRHQLCTQGTGGGRTSKALMSCFDPMATPPDTAITAATVGQPQALKLNLAGAIVAMMSTAPPLDSTVIPAMKAAEVKDANDITVRHRTRSAIGSPRQIRQLGKTPGFFDRTVNARPMFDGNQTAQSLGFDLPTTRGFADHGRPMLTAEGDLLVADMSTVIAGAQMAHRIGSGVHLVS